MLPRNPCIPYLLNLGRRPEYPNAVLCSVPSVRETQGVRSSQRSIDICDVTSHHDQTNCGVTAESASSSIRLTGALITPAGVDTAAIMASSMYQFTTF